MLKSELIAENKELKAQLELRNKIIEDNDDQDFVLGKIQELEEEIEDYSLQDIVNGIEECVEINTNNQVTI